MYRFCRMSEKNRFYYDKTVAKIGVMKEARGNRCSWDIAGKNILDWRLIPHQVEENVTF